MLVNLAELTSAVDKVKVMASDKKQGIPGVLLKTMDNALAVCYTDGTKSVYEKVGALLGENEQFGDIIVPYATFIDIIDICKPEGVVQVEDINIDILENSMVRVSVEKFIELAVSEEETTHKVVSRLRQEVKFNRPEEDKRQSILTRMNYDSIFEHEVYDSWDKTKFVSILKRASKEDDKVLLISSNKKSASVANLAYSVYIPCEDVINCGMCMTSKTARNIIDILGKTSCNEIEIHTENNQYCTINTTDNKVGIWFEMGKPSRMQIQVIEEYTSHKYDTFRAVMLKQALENVAKCCNAVNNGNESIELNFVETEAGETQLVFNGVGTASKGSDFSVVVESSTGNSSETYGINLSCLLNILSLCNETYVAFDFLVDERGKFLRVADILGKNTDGTVDAGALYFTTVK